MQLLLLLSFLITLLGATFVFSFDMRKRVNLLLSVARGPLSILTAVTLSYFSLAQKSLPLASFVMLFLIILSGSRLFFYHYKKKSVRDIQSDREAKQSVWGERGKLYFFLRSYVEFYVVEAVIITILLLPFTLSFSHHAFSLLTCLGICLYFIGFFFAVVSDAERDTFYAKRGGTEKSFITTGLFAYTRHPHHFGECLMWASLAVIALSSGASYFVLLSPLLITFITLYFVIPKEEALLGESSAWESYSKQTRIFFPFPKR